MTDPAAPAPIEAIIKELKDMLRLLGKSKNGHLPVEIHQKEMAALLDHIDRLRAALAAAGGPMVVTEEAAKAAYEAFFLACAQTKPEPMRIALEAALPHLRPAVLPSEEEITKIILNEQHSYNAARAILALFHSRIGAGSEAAPPAPASRSTE